MIFSRKDKHTRISALALLLFYWVFLSVCAAQDGMNGNRANLFAGVGSVVDRSVIGLNDPDDGEWLDFDDEQFWDELLSEQVIIADPLEPLNRIFFKFNDKLYYWALKPAATVYSSLVPEDVRVCIRNSFNNLLAPVRIVNNLLQGKVRNSGIELFRFLVNSTLGIAGLGDPAKDMGLAAAEEDLGQTLGVYGVGEGIYLYWPLFGPSNIRDTLGLIGDSFLDPLTYMGGSQAASAAWKGGRHLNNISLTLGDYELFTSTALDPYAAARNAYSQYRRGRIKDQAETTTGGARTVRQSNGQYDVHYRIKITSRQKGDKLAPEPAGAGTVQQAGLENLLGKDVADAGSDEAGIIKKHSNLFINENVRRIFNLKKYRSIFEAIKDGTS